MRSYIFFWLVSRSSVSLSCICNRSIRCSSTAIFFVYSYSLTLISFLHTSRSFIALSLSVTACSREGKGDLSRADDFGTPCPEVRSRLRCVIDCCPKPKPAPPTLSLRRFGGVRSRLLESLLGVPPPAVGVKRLPPYIFKFK
jgi:hypothetical protein